MAKLFMVCERHYDDGQVKVGKPKFTTTEKSYYHQCRHHDFYCTVFNFYKEACHYYNTAKKEENYRNE